MMEFLSNDIPSLKCSRDVVPLLNFQWVNSPSLGLVVISRLVIGLVSEVQTRSNKNSRRDEIIDILERC